MIETPSRRMCDGFEKIVRSFGGGGDFAPRDNFGHESLGGARGFNNEGGGGFRFENKSRIRRFRPDAGTGS